MNINKYKYLVLTLIFPVVSYAQEAATSVSDVATTNSGSDIKIGWTDLVVFILCLVPALFIAVDIGRYSVEWAKSRGEGLWNIACVALCCGIYACAY